MSLKVVHVDGIGEITLQRRQGTKSLRISISAAGVVKVSMPNWAPYKMGISFATSKVDWIAKHRPVVPMITDNTPVGKAHHIKFMKSARANTARSSVRDNELIIWVPEGLATTSSEIQKRANLSAIRILKAEASQLLPPKLALLAKKHDFTYNNVAIKRLSTRWGSCDSHKNITLNCYLMQLPWHLIEYVMLHELVHTRVMAHGQKFWSELDNYVPNLVEVRKEIKNAKPALAM